MRTIFTKNKGLLLVALIIVGVLFFVQPTLAADWAARMLAGLISVIISAIGYIIGLVIEVLIYIAQYNGFIKADAVSRGWEVVRDLSNMFFVLILLIISFATILHIESYSYKKALPKFLLMAILINFSKTLAGLVIDFAQVIMLTFVNGFKDIGQGNLVHMMGLKEVLSVKEDVDVSFWTVAAAYMLGLLYVIIALVIVTAMLATLVMRIVMIWIYVILSPLAFLLGSFPGTQKYFSQWWGNFSKEVVIGPVLAFFIWLSFVSVTITSDGSDILKMDVDTGAINAGEYGEIEGEKKAGIPTEAADPEVFIRFIVSVGLLLGGLMVSKQIGAGAGKAMDRTVSTFQKGGRSLSRGAGRVVKRGARAAGGTVKNWGGDLRDNISEGLGVDLNVVAGYKRYQGELEKRRQEKKARISGKVSERIDKGGFGGKMAMLSTGDLAWQNFKEHRLGVWGGAAFGNRQAGLKNREADVVSNEAEIKKLKTEREGVITTTENFGMNQDLTNLRAEKASGQVKKEYVDSAIVANESELADPNITDSRRKELDGYQKLLKPDAEDLENKDKDYDSKISTLENRMSKGSVDDVKAASLDKKIGKETENLGKSQSALNEFRDKKAWIGLTGSRISSQAESDSDASKVIAHIDNSGDLVEMFKEGIKTGNQALARVSYKKLAKTGNYNDLHRELGYGTGYDGMHDLAENELKEKGGFSHQAAMSLLGEVGELTKANMHFGGFGVVENNNGEWDYAGKDNYQANQMVEMSKIQIQKLMRDLNRLGAGEYTGPTHDPAHWDVSDAFVLSAASKDGQYAKQMRETGNMNLILHIAGKKENIQKLEKAGAIETAKAVRDMAEDLKKTKAYSMMENPVKAVQDLNL